MEHFSFPIRSAHAMTHVNTLVVKKKNSVNTTPFDMGGSLKRMRRGGKCDVLLHCPLYSFFLEKLHYFSLLMFHQSEQQFLSNLHEISW